LFLGDIERAAFVQPSRQIGPRIYEVYGACWSSATDPQSLPCRSLFTNAQPITQEKPVVILTYAVILTIEKLWSQ
jgi:hypothetical protein